MDKEIMYIELCTGFNHDGPAWISFVKLSKSKRTKYFNGKALKQATGNYSNHYDIETSEEYWLSGIKKRGSNRHRAGKGKIQIDKLAVDTFLKIKNIDAIDNKKYEIVNINNRVDLEKISKLENS